MHEKSYTIKTPQVLDIFIFLKSVTMEEELLSKTTRTWTTYIQMKCNIGIVLAKLDEIQLSLIGEESKEKLVDIKSDMRALTELAEIEVKAKLLIFKTQLE